jgi:hypothetical protein
MLEIISIGYLIVGFFYSCITRYSSNKPMPLGHWIGFMLTWFPLILADILDVEL